MTRTLIALALAALLAPGVAHAGKAERRLVNLGLSPSADVDPKVERALEDTVAAHVDQAAQVRGYELVPLRRVSGLEEEAAACRARACRRDILRRLAASHGLSGTLERRPRGYRVSFWLEDAKTGELIRAVRLEGEVPALVGRLRAAVEEVLEAGAPKEAVARERLLKTARGYLKKARVDDAVRTLERAVDLAPFHPDAARAQLEIVDVFDKRDDEARVLEAVDVAIEMYGPRSMWAKAEIGGDEVQRDVHRRLLEVLSRRGTTAHRKALALTSDGDASQRRSLLEGARQLYRRYVLAMGVLGDDGRLPAGDEEAAEITFYLGEVEYELGAFEEAARAYRAVRDTDGARQREEAAANVLFALEKALTSTGAFDPAAAPLLKEPRRELPPLLASYVEGALKLAELAGGRDDAPSYLYRAAAAELAFGRKEEGRKLLEQVVAGWPKSEAGRAAKAFLTTLR